MATSPRDYFSGWTPQPFTRRNMIINGDFRIAQRGTGPTSGTGYNTLDRWRNNTTAAEMARVERPVSSTLPWSYEMRMEKITSAGNMQAIATVELDRTGHAGVFAQGQKFTLSFWTYCNAPTERLLSVSTSFSDGSVFTNAVALGDFLTDEPLELSNWQKHEATIEITADPVATNLCFRLNFNAQNMEVGEQVSFAQVQLELGAKATEFEYRSIGEELALCQRYYQKIGGDKQAIVIGAGHHADSGTSFRNTIWLPTVPRATPTVKLINSGSLSVRYADRVERILTTGNAVSPVLQGNAISFNVTTSTAAFLEMGNLYIKTTGGAVEIDAEL